MIRAILGGILMLLSIIGLYAVGDGYGSDPGLSIIVYSILCFLGIGLVVWGTRAKSKTKYRTHGKPAAKLTIHSKVLSWALLAAFSFGILLFIPLVRDEINWKIAISRNHAEAFGNYMKNQPEGSHFVKARLLFDQKCWEEACTLNSLEGYNSYLRSNPKGNYSALACERIEEMTWEAAKRENSPDLVSKYIDAYPDGKYTGQARDKMEELAWKQACDGNTAAFMKRYLEQYPAGRYAADAVSKKEQLLQDDAIYKNTISVGSRKAIEAFLDNYPGHIHEADAKKILLDMDGRNLTELIAEKKVEVMVSGMSIDSIKVRLHRLTRYDIGVMIPAGTLFVSRKKSVQNMVATGSKTITLDADAWFSTDVPVACTNKSRDIPCDADSFSVQASPFQKSLGKLIPVLDEEKCSFPVIQAAVWIITDNANYDGLGTLISDSEGFGSRLIKEEETAEAMYVIDKAGIDIRSKAVWRDRKAIAKGVERQDLKDWLLADRK